VTPRPARLVLLGHPVAHSLSPRIQNAALHSAGIDCHYDALDVEPSAFETTIELLRAERAAGNVTVPHKERMFAACEAMSPLARHVGAVNTFWFDEDGRLTGDNTDVGGFAASVHRLLGQTPHDISIGVLGAGGAAAAVLAAIEMWPGCDAHVYNRTPERAQLLCERFGSIARAVDDVGVIAGAQLVVNATSIGLHDDSLPIDLSLVSPDAVVADLVYRPGETAFVREARRRGHRAVDGLGMLVEQAALAFERWFGVNPDRSLMATVAGETRTR
jgi:shikimate dehydrogenase